MEFDRIFQNIFILKNKEVLERRSIDEVSEVVMSIKLKQKVDTSAASKQLSLSDDGTMCAIGGGYTSHFYLVNLESKAQHKLTSKTLRQTRAPCFINGATAFVAVGGGDEQGVEIWDLAKKEANQLFKVDSGYIGCMTSTNNILAVASSNGKLQLRDVRNWDVFYSSEFEGLYTYSLHLTADSQYLTIGGQLGDQCVVMKVQ